MQAIYPTQGHPSSQSQLVNPGLSHCNLFPIFGTLPPGFCTCCVLNSTPSSIPYFTDWPNFHLLIHQDTLFYLGRFPELQSTPLYSQRSSFYFLNHTHCTAIAAYPLASSFRTQACTLEPSATPGTWQVLWRKESSKR